MTQTQQGGAVAPPKPQEPPKPTALGKFAVKKSKPSSPRMLVYGQGGIGKTTLGAKFPNPLFVCFEKGLNSDALVGTSYIDEINSWQEFMQFLDEFKNSEYKTLVIDTLDVLVSGIFNKYLCSKFKDGEHLGDFATLDYGKGTTVAQQEIKLMLNKLDIINSSNKLILILAHSMTKTFQNPLGKDYDTYMIKGNEKVNDVVKCWADEVYFANFITEVNKDGKATGKTRWLDCENSPAAFAKSRFGLTGMKLEADSLLDALRSKIKGGTAQ